MAVWSTPLARSSARASWTMVQTGAFFSEGRCPGACWKIEGPLRASRAVCYCQMASVAATNWGFEGGFEWPALDVVGLCSPGRALTSSVGCTSNDAWSAPALGCSDGPHDRIGG